MRNIKLRAVPTAFETLVTLILMAMMTWLLTVNHISDGGMWPTAGIAFVFSLMVVEDYKFQTVDIRLLTLMLLIMALSSDNRLEFSYRVVAAGIFFRCLMLLLSAWTTWRAGCGKGDLSGIVIKRLKESMPEPRYEGFTDDKRYGYLPIFALTLIGYLLFISMGFETPEIFANICESVRIIADIFRERPDVALFTLSTVFILWLNLEVYFHYKEKFGDTVVYAFGGGDVAVLAIFAGLLGFEALLWLFMASLVVQLAVYGTVELLKICRGGLR